MSDENEKKSGGGGHGLGTIKIITSLQSRIDLTLHHILKIFIL